MADFDLLSKVSVASANRMQTKVNVIGADYSDLSSQFSTTIPNSIDSSIDILSDFADEGNGRLGNQRKSNLTVPFRDSIDTSLSVYSDAVIEQIGWNAIYGNQRRSSLYVKYRNDLVSNVGVAPHNRMSVTVDVVPPPMIKVQFSPLADAFVRSKAQTLNYGTEQSMMVGSSSDGLEKYKALMKFDVSSIPQNVEIKQATLKLYNQTLLNTNVLLGFMNPSGSWTESGVTWRNQPSIEDTYTTKNINQIGNFEADLTSIVNDWYLGNVVNDGFIIDALNETNALIQFATKENSQNQPVLEVEYYDPVVYSFGRSDIAGDGTVRINKSSDLNSSIFIKSAWSDNSIPSDIHVMSQDMRESFITVSMPNIQSTIGVKQRADNYIDSSVAVRLKDLSEIASTITVSAGDRVGIIVVPYRDNLQSDMEVRQTANSEIYSDIIISQVAIGGEGYVKPFDSLDSTITVRSGVAFDTESTITVSSPTISGNITARRTETSDLTIEIVVRQKVNSYLTSSITVSRPDLVGYLQPIVGNYLDSSITVRQKDNSPINTTIIVPYRKDLQSNVKVFYYNTIEGNLTIRSKYLVGTGTVKWRKDLNTTITVRAKWASDIECTLKIGSTSSGYAFIL